MLSMFCNNITIYKQNKPAVARKGRPYAGVGRPANGSALLFSYLRNFDILNVGERLLDASITHGRDLIVNTLQVKSAW